MRKSFLLAFLLAAVILYSVSSLFTITLFSSISDDRSNEIADGNDENIRINHSKMAVLRLEKEAKMKKIEADAVESVNANLKAQNLLVSDESHSYSKVVVVKKENNNKDNVVENHTETKTKSSKAISSLVILLLCYKRPDYLKSTLDSLLKVPGIENYPILISQDGYEENTAKVALSYPNSVSSQTPIASKNDVSLGKIHLIHHPREIGSTMGATHFVASHYKWAFDQVFFTFQFEFAIVVEEDMIFSPDFISYFESTVELLRNDASIWCVSSWNDNAFSKNTFKHPTKIHRTDYFPGLGWMLQRSLWQELAPKFPIDHWDHWMRVSSQSRGRECLFPELSRNHNIGESGSTMDGGKFSMYFSNAQYSQDFHHFDNVSYLYRDKYVPYIENLVKRAKILPSSSQLQEFITRERSSYLSVENTGRDIINNDGNNNDDDSDVYMILYKREEFENFISKILDIYQPARCTHRGLQLLRITPKVILIVANIRSPDPSYLSKEQRELPSPTFQATPANPRTNCDITCGNSNKKCDESQFEFLNSCEVLTQVFKCPNGCMFETGLDLPNFVSEISHANYGKCLVTNEAMHCIGEHQATSRLCPCV